MGAGGTTSATARGLSRSFLCGAGLILLFNGLLLTGLLLKPGGHALTVAVDDIAQALGPLLAVPLCFLGGAPSRARATAGPDGSVGATRRWAPSLLGLGVLSFAAGQGIWAVYELILHQPPFPSWADAGYLSAYPFLLLGVLLLPTRPLPLAARARIVTDGLITMTAVVTFSWYLILGPTLLQGAETLFGRIVGTAYPLWDLVLIFCLIVLSARSSDRSMRSVVRILSLALGIIVATDCVFDLQNLQGTYATGGIVDVGWPLGYMLVALAAHRARLADRAAPASAAAGSDATTEGVALSANALPGGSASAAGAVPEPAAEAPRLWHALLPYVLVPAVAALVVLCTWCLHAGMPLRMGVYVGGVLLVALVVLRQVLALLENRYLYSRLAASYRQTLADAARMQRLNDELRATRDELQRNNRALTEANLRLQALATTDPLTDLPNHRSLVTVIDQELERAHRYGRPCALIFFDLDHFKALNDSCGHQAGDAALRELAALVRSTLRGIDVLGRWGSEEFVALLPEADGEVALATAERVRSAVAGHCFSAGGGIRLTCSVGVATYPGDSHDRDGLVTAADQAMYAAKHLGRNQVRSAAEPAVAVLTATGVTGSREDAALVGTVEALAAMVEARSHYGGQHTNAVANLAMRLALALGLDASEAHLIGLAGRLHDVGKVAIPDTVLQKLAHLTEEEWELMRGHPAAGADVVSRVPGLRVLAPLIGAHHEHWDGSGYPDGLAGEAIPLGARIVAVADAYRAMTADRPHRKASTPTEAQAELRRCAGTQFDPAVIAALEQVLAPETVSAEHTSVA